MTTSTDPKRLTRPDSRHVGYEVVLVLALTFGMSGLRSILKLADALLDPRALNEQSVQLNAHQASAPSIDVLLQLTSVLALSAYGLLGIYLLGRNLADRRGIAFPHLRDWGWGLALAAVIGVPGLVFYVTAVNLGLSKEVVPAPLDGGWMAVVLLLLWSAANAFSEEIVVVMYMVTRLRQLRWAGGWILVATSLLRGSYHLYQGVSAGFGNIAMGLVFGFFYMRTGRIWPLIIAHFLIDAVAFVGYRVLGGDLGFLGL